jgi:formylmethanofuran dehydrogenase subunit E
MGVPASPTLTACLERLAALHPRLCPRQVLGVRMGLYAGTLLGVDLPREDKRMLALVETDGCFADGVSVATGCWLGRRTLRLLDYGKVAVTIVDVRTGRAMRTWPDPRARSRATVYAPEAPDRWHAQLAGYQLMPPEQLLRAEGVQLGPRLASILGAPAAARVTCTQCGEEILNRRELATPHGPVCRGCAGTPHGEPSPTALRPTA